MQEGDLTITYIKNMKFDHIWCKVTYFFVAFLIIRQHHIHFNLIIMLPSITDGKMSLDEVGGHIDPETI